ncbi:MAG: alpha/beta family hydrolase [Rhodothermales bacterium]
MASESFDRLLSFEASETSGSVSAILRRPENAKWLYVLAHGAGAGMRHPFMETIAQFLAERRIATFRYQFPYMEAGRRAPNPRPILLKTVRSAVTAASNAAPNLPLLAGGKSMGGRMTSLAASETPLPNVNGLVFLGFPLHAVGKPSSERGDHLKATRLPMLFVQGTRDKLADLALLEPLIGEIGPAATMHVIEEGDHSFHVPKRTGTNQTEVLASVAETIADWAESLSL